MLEEELPVTIAGVTITEEAGAVRHFVTLQDAAEREMRVYIGKTEAAALSLGLQGHAPERPGTYDALLACVTAAGSVVEKVSMSDLREEVYHAAATLRIGSQSRTVDMRPSDALNVAVRTHCPISVAAAVFAASLAPEPSADVTVKTVTVTPLAEISLIAEETSAELARLFAEDQSDRVSWSEGHLSEEVIVPRDAARLARVKQLYHGQALQSGLDYFHAAMVLQHSSSADDYLLAHEFCIVAISLGAEQAKWLAAASEDRFLQKIGRLQRFGTQWRKDSPDGPWLPGIISPEIEGSLRAALNVPSSLEAQAQMEEMNAKPT